MGELDFESSAFSRARPPLRFYLLPLILPHNAKKIPKNCRTLLGKYSTVYGYAVIQSTIVAKLIQRFHCSRLGIKTAENEPAYSRLQNGPHTHDARLECHVKLTIGQTPSIKVTRCLLDGQHLGMSQSRTQLFPAVMAATDDLCPKRM
jgi:hypothetical protein